jgi:hypothetical protein
MTVTAKPIIEPLQASNVQTTQYTAPAGTRTIIDKFSGTNTSGAAASLSVNLVASGDAAGNQNLIVKTKTLQPGESYTFPELVGHVLSAGDFISTIASAGASITVRASGREVS